MGDRSKIVEAAKSIVSSGSYKYGQVSPRDWDDDKMDCSEFIAQAYRRAGFDSFPTDYDTAAYGRKFRRLGEDELPQAGDIIYWDYGDTGPNAGKGHVGIVEDPVQGTYIGAQSTRTGLKSGVSYKAGHWSARGSYSSLPGRAISFLRYGE